jgi:signal transduction histidine kinase
MARELHDIAAHHLSGIAVMTGAIGRQIDVDPEGAKEAVRRVRGETTAMLGELRGLVRLLRDTTSGEDADEAHVETLATVPALVDRARASGIDATLTMHHTPDGRPPQDVVGPLAQLAAYRTVQECLANVVRHAPGARCEVVLDARDPAALAISVRNGPPPAPTLPPALPPGVTATLPGGGLGLVGMRERADLTDARLDHGPQPDGGWLVTLTLPVGGTTGPTPGPAPGTDPTDGAHG